MVVVLPCHLLLLSFIFCFVFSERMVVTNGVHLRASAVPVPPIMFIELDKNGTMKYKGVAVDVMDWLARRLKFTYTFQNVNISVLLAIGAAPAAIDQLIKDEVDIVSFFVSPNEERLSYMDFTIPLIMEPFRLVVPWPEEENRLYAPIRPFQNQVWIWLFLSWTAYIFATILIKTLRERLLYNEFSRWDVTGNVLYVVNVYTRQGDTTPAKLTFRWLLSGVMCLMALVLVNTYSGILTSFLTIPTYKPIINSLEDSSRRTDVELLADINAIHTKMILEATSGPYKKLGDRLRSNKDLFIRTREETLNKLREGKYAALTSETLVYFNLDLLRTKEGKCICTSSKRLPLFIFHSFGLPKNGPYNNALNKEISLLTSTGLFDFWTKKFLPKNVKCLTVKTTAMKKSSLKLEYVYSAFVIWGFGIGISLIAFSCELMWKYLVVRDRVVNTH